MSLASSSANPDCFDVLVAGAGPVGLSAAILCAQKGLKTCLVGREESQGSGRTVALMQGALEFYDSLGLTEAIAAASAPLATMRLVDVTDSPFRSRPLAFRAAEIGLAAFGRNIGNAELIGALLRRLHGTANFERLDGYVDAYDLSPDAASATVGGRRLSAGLIVAADGRNSPARFAAGIRSHPSTYDQIALTALLAHDAPHGDASTEFHTRGGAFTLVPLPPTEAEPRRSSLVWMARPADARRLLALDAAAFARAVERRAQSLLGKMRLESAVGATPMGCLRVDRLAQRRVLLAGDSGHGFPPIGAQGLNLGLRDLVELGKLLDRFPDPGSPAALARYERDRRADVDLRTTVVDGANRLLLTPSLPADFLRGLGFLALSGLGPARRAAMRIGLGPTPLPALLRSVAGQARGALDGAGPRRP